MRDAVTTVLDIVGLLAVAIGFGWWIWQQVSPPAGLVAGGVVIGLVSAIVAAQDERRGQQQQEAEGRPAQAGDGSA